MNTCAAAIRKRIAQLRVEYAGDRGKASFASALGISPSTYNYYESSRVPPAELLVRIADICKADIRWLLTGEAVETRKEQMTASTDHPIVRRAAELLAGRPNAAAPLAAFLDILSASLAFPAKVAAETSQAASAKALIARAGKPVPPAAPASWIPILGRSAAGVARFWADKDEAKGLTTLNDLIARHAARPHRTTEALARGEQAEEFAVQFITLTSPTDEAGEFIAAPGIRACYGDAFAVRIDGDSMAPDIRHGDAVILSPSAPAVSGKPAVVQLAGQIGATCKIFRRQGDTVHLIPINEQFAPQSFPTTKIEWALRVLAKVRP